MGKPIRDKDALITAKLHYRECAICGTTEGLHVHHILFRSHGGDDVPENLCVLCLYDHDEIHAYKAFAWYALETYIRAERKDVLLYLRQKLGDGSAVFFRRLSSPPITLTPE
jgi:hypothetical protein